MAIDRDELIGRRAYQLWEAEGRPDGGDFRHWLQASEEVGEASIGEMANYDRIPAPKAEATDAASGETKSKARRTAKSPPSLEPASIKKPRGRPAKAKLV
jgi:hypothetical protein